PQPRVRETPSTRPSPRLPGGLPPPITPHEMQRRPRCSETTRRYALIEPPGGHHWNPQPTSAYAPDPRLGGMVGLAPMVTDGSGNRATTSRRQQADRESVTRVTDDRIAIRHINGSRPSRNHDRP